MTIIIYLFGLFLILSGLILLIMPALIFNLLEKHKDRPGMFVSAIAARLILGGILIYMAPLSGFPLTIAIIGWVSLIAAGAITTIRIKRFQALMNWVLDHARPFSWLAGVVSAGLGAFLIYAFY